MLLVLSCAAIAAWHRGMILGALPSAALSAVLLAAICALTTNQASRWLFAAAIVLLCILVFRNPTAHEVLREHLRVPADWIVSAKLVAEYGRDVTYFVRAELTADGAVALSRAYSKSVDKPSRPAAIGPRPTQSSVGWWNPRDGEDTWTWTSSGSDDPTVFVHCEADARTVHVVVMWK